MSSRPTDPAVLGVVVDDRGVTARSRDEVILDVLFDGRRIWSFWLHRDGEPSGRDHVVAWPAALRTFLEGTARISVAVSRTGQVVFDEEVVLGDGEGRIDISDADGNPLALDKSFRRVKTFESRSREQMKPLLGAMEEVLAALHGIGVDAFVAYGTLLGAVRDGTFIGHDSDADLGYVSRHDHPADVALESYRIQRALTRLGYRTDRYSAAAIKVYVSEEGGITRGLDVFGGFLRDGKLHLMGEIRAPFASEWMWPLGTVELDGHAFPAPAQPERLLEVTYGPSWRVPDPAFQFVTPTSTTRRLNGWFRGLRGDRSMWDRRYSRPATTALEPSPFVQAVAEAEGLDARFVDIGCGRGADTWWLASQGASAVGTDFVRRGYAAAQERAQAEGADARFHFMNLLETRSVLGTSALVAATTPPGVRTVVTARHVADCVNDAALANLWRAGRMLLAGGGRMHVEFLTRRAGDGYGRAHRVFAVRPVTVAESAKAAGAVIRGREIVPVGDDADEKGSRVCRMVMEW